MLFRSISILLLLSLTAFGQAFTPRRPFILQSLASPVTPPFTNPLSIPGLAYWWVANDLSNSPVSGWTDRVQSVVFATTNNKPTWQTNVLGFAKVQFWETNWMRITPPIELSINVGTSNPCVLLIFDQSNNPTAGGTIMGTTNPPTSSQWFGMQDTKLRWNVYDLTNVPANTIMDVLYSAASTASTNGIYTNGFLGWTNVGQTPSGFGIIGNRYDKGSNGGFNFKGSIYEMAIWTNNQGGQGLTSLQISNLHYYATNTYKFVP